MIVNYKIHEVSEYINWIYFFHAWGFQPKFAAIADIHGCDSCRAMWLTGFAEEDRPKASEAMQLFKEANRMLNELDTAYQTHGVVNIMDANADGDDLLLNSKRFPLLRQQTAKLKEDDPFLCLSDFVRPLSSGITDKIGAFATTVDAEMERLYAEDDYKRMLVQTLSDRLAEATAEKLHEDVRKKLWGYAPDENLSVKDLHNEISRDTSCRRLSFLARPIRQFPIRRVAGYEANRNFIDREWYDEAPCLCMRTHVCPSGFPLFLHRKNR